jgi:hypothetical protein
MTAAVIKVTIQNANCNLLKHDHRTLTMLVWRLGNMLWEHPTACRVALYRAPEMHTTLIVEVTTSETHHNTAERAMTNQPTKELTKG